MSNITDVTDVDNDIIVFDPTMKHRQIVYRDIIIHY